MQEIEFITEGKESSPDTIILAHSSGEPMNSEFMNYFSKHLSELGFFCIRFQFPYMTKQIIEGRKKPPDKIDSLIKSWCIAINHINKNNIIIGGKSMGGRIATLIANKVNPKGIVVLGYPFFNPKGKTKNRTEHLKNINIPTLICQGENDTLGKRPQVEKLHLSKKINLHWIESANHSLIPLKRTGKTRNQSWDECIIAINKFIKNLN